MDVDGKDGWAHVLSRSLHDDWHLIFISSTDFTTPNKDEGLKVRSGLCWVPWH